MTLLLLVESNTTGTGRQFARRATALGIEPVLVCADPDRYPYAAKDGLRHVVTDTSDEAAVLATARALARDEAIAGVTSSSEYYVACAAATAAALGLPGPDGDAVRACRDKGVQRGVLRAAGVGVPRYAVAGTAAEVATSGLDFPVVVKPVRGSGSVGVRWCDSAAVASAHAAALLDTPVNERGLAAAGQVLIEEYVTGPEFSVEVFAGHPVVVVAKHTGALPWFVETGHDLPATLPGDTEQLVTGIAIDAVRVLRMTWGAVHVEVRLAAAGPRIIEVNPRPAGGMIPELVRHALGVDLVDAQVRAAVGLDPGVAVRNAAYASIRFLVADRDAVVAQSDRAVAAAAAVPGVVDAAVNRADGAHVAPAADFRGRTGHVIAVAEEARRATDAADEGLKLLGEALRQPATDGTR